MTTLLLAQDFPPRGGGIARLHGELAKRFPRGELVVSTPADPDAAEVDSGLPAIVDRLPMGVRRTKTLPAVLFWSRRAASLARQHRVAFVHCGNVKPAGYPAGFTLPQCTKATRCWRARLAARRDQNKTAGSVLVRRTPMGSRSTMAGRPLSTSAASGSAGVETMSSPRGNRLASSPCKRAMPPPLGGKSCARSNVVIATNLGSRPAEFPVDPDQVGRDAVPVVVALHGLTPRGAQAAPQRLPPRG